MSLPAEVEYRSAELVYREEPDGSGGGVLEGRMIPYGAWTEIRSSIEGHFMERVMPGAFTKTIAERAHRLRVLFEHGFGMLDVQPIAALEDVREEADGPYYRAGLLGGLPDLLVSGLRAGLYGTSVAMRPMKGDVVKRAKVSDANPEGIEERTITEAYLKEISVVTFPAYEGATATVRSLTDDRFKRLVRDHPLVVEFLRAEQEGEPTHSEPAPQDEPAADTGSRDTQPETNPPPAPRRDWLAPTEEKPAWRLP